MTGQEWFVLGWSAFVFVTLMYLVGWSAVRLWTFVSNALAMGLTRMAYGKCDVEAERRAIEVVKYMNDRMPRWAGGR